MTKHYQLLHRNKYYQLLAIGKKQMGMDEDTYRELLQQSGAKLKDGKVSATTMSRIELEKALTTLRDLGFKPKAKAKIDNFKEARIKKCEAMWHQLHAEGAMRLPYTEDRLAKWAASITGKRSIRWATPVELNHVIEGLKSFAVRSGVTLNG